MSEHIHNYIDICLSYDEAKPYTASIHIIANRWHWFVQVLHPPQYASPQICIEPFTKTTTKRSFNVYIFHSHKQSCRKKRLKRPKTAHYKSKKQLLDESLTRLYPQRVNFIPPHSHRPDEIACALRLQRQYEKTLQKRSKQINKTTKPKFRSLTKNLSCYNTRIRDSQKLLLYESPYHSMNVDQYDYRPLKKSPVPWEFRMYNKPKRFDHFATKTQTVTINTTESYKQMDAVVHNMYRQSVRDFFGEEYDMKTGIDYGYTVNNSKNPVYV
eukprot:963049_1